MFSEIHNSWGEFCSLYRAPALLSPFIKMQQVFRPENLYSSAGNYRGLVFKK